MQQLREAHAPGRAIADHGPGPRPPTGCTCVARRAQPQPLLARVFSASNQLQDEPPLRRIYHKQACAIPDGFWLEAACVSLDRAEQCYTLYNPHGNIDSVRIIERQASSWDVLIRMRQAPILRAVGDLVTNGRRDDVSRGPGSCDDGKGSNNKANAM